METLEMAGYQARSSFLNYRKCRGLQVPLPWVIEGK